MDVRSSTACMAASAISTCFHILTETPSEVPVVLAVFAVVFAVREHSQGVALEKLKQEMNNKESE